MGHERERRDDPPPADRLSFDERLAALEAQADRLGRLEGSVDQLNDRLTRAQERLEGIIARVGIIAGQASKGEADLRAQLERKASVRSVEDLGQAFDGHVSRAEQRAERLGNETSRVEQALEGRIYDLETRVSCTEQEVRSIR